MYPTPCHDSRRAPLARAKRFLLTLGTLAVWALANRGPHLYFSGLDV